MDVKSFPFCAAAQEVRLFAGAFSSVVHRIVLQKRAGLGSPPPQLAPAGSLTRPGLPGFAFSTAFPPSRPRVFLSRQGRSSFPRKTLHCCGSTELFDRTGSCPGALNESLFAWTLFLGLIMRPEVFPARRRRFHLVIHYRDPLNVDVCTTNHSTEEP